MASTLPRDTAERHRLLPETTTVRAKADLRKAETDWRQAMGRVIAQVQGTLSLKEFAAVIGREERQVARWKSGDEHPQMAAVFAVEAFRHPLILALAELAGQDVQITTQITIRRTA